VKRLAGFLLVLGVLKHYVWPMFGAAHQTSVWTMAGAVTTGALVLALAVVCVGQFDMPRRVAQAAVLVALWWIGEELVVFACEVLYLVRPMVAIGDERCTAQLGVNVSTYGLLVVALLTLRLGPGRYDSSQAATDGDNHGQ
jgi:hypothetical protein